MFNTVTSDNTWLHHPRWNTMTVCGGISTSIYMYNTMLNPLQRGFFCINYWYQKVFWSLNHHKFLSDSFAYLCFGSTTIRNILILLVRGPSIGLYVRIRRLQTQILTYKDGPRAERVECDYQVIKLVDISKKKPACTLKCYINLFVSIIPSNCIFQEQRARRYTVMT